jgi:hypothetical protein
MRSRGCGNGQTNSIRFARFFGRLDAHPTSLQGEQTPRAPASRRLSAHGFVRTAIGCAASHARSGRFRKRADIHSSAQEARKRGRFAGPIKPGIGTFLIGLVEGWESRPTRSSSSSTANRQPNCGCSLIKLLHALRRIQRRIVARARTNRSLCHERGIPQQADNRCCGSTLRWHKTPHGRSGKPSPRWISCLQCRRYRRKCGCIVIWRCPSQRCARCGSVVCRGRLPNCCRLQRGQGCQ